MRGPTSPLPPCLLGSQEPDPKSMPSESCHPPIIAGTWVWVAGECMYPKHQVAGGLGAPVGGGVLPTQQISPCLRECDMNNKLKTGQAAKATEENKSFFPLLFEQRALHFYYAPSKSWSLCWLILSSLQAKCSQ